MLDVEDEEVVVAAAEHRRAQRFDEREPVARVVDRAQRHQQVAYLAAAVDERARLRPIRHAGVAERTFEVPERRTGGQQDADVAEPGRPPLLPLAVEHGPFVGDGRACDRGDVGRFPGAQLRGLRLGVGMGLDPEEHDLPIVFGGHRPRGLERAVLGLRSRARADELGEHVVDPAEDARRRPEVAGEKTGRAGRELLFGREERGDVGAPEPVDRLLGITDEEEPARLDAHLRPRTVGIGGIVGPEQRGELDLDRVGVLELVDQDAVVALPEPGAGGRTVLRIAQQHAGEDQQVVEVELARHLPQRDRTRRSAPRSRRRPA